MNTSAPAVRLHGLDIARGLLVLCMVAYHSTYASRSQGVLQIRTLLPVISYSFLLLSGFLYGWRAATSPAQGLPTLARTLRWRALRLILLLLLINAACYAFGINPRGNLAMLSSLSGLWRNLILTVNGNLVTCEVLAYIGGFLILVSFLRSAQWMLPACCGLAMLAPFFPGQTVIFLSCGFLGTAAGALVHGPTGRLVDRFGRRAGQISFIVIVAHCLLSPGTLHFPLRILSVLFAGAQFLLWTLATLWLCSLPGMARPTKALAALGRYSLAAYILQLPAIALARHILSPHIASPFLLWGAIVLAALVACAGALLVMARTRQVSPSLDRLYRFFLG